MQKNVKGKKEVTIKNGAGGITLIALVITIVVLLILAAVTIASLSGENGLLTRATEAKEKNRGATVKESVDLWKMEKYTNENTGGTNTKKQSELIEELASQGLLNDEELEQIEENGVVTIGGITISFSKTLVEAFIAEEIEIGSYVNYTPNSATTPAEAEKEDTGYDATQTYKVDTTTQWRVLGLSEDGKNLLLTSASPIKKDDENDPYLIMQGAESYINCKKTLDKICGIYKNDLADEVRSMTIDDINNALGLTVDKINKALYKKTDTEKTTPLQFQGFFGESYKYVAGDYAPENYMLDTYGEKYNNLTRKSVSESANGKVDGSTYMYPYTESSIVDQDSTIYDILFSKTTESEGYTKSYWLASPGVFVGSGFAVFGPGAVNGGDAGSGVGVFTSGGYWDAYEFAVRPVVVLNSGVSVDEIKVVEEKTDNWDTTKTPDFEGEGHLEETTGQVE